MMNLKYRFEKHKLNIFIDTFLSAHNKGQTLPPKLLAWDCSRKCNLNCRHCGAKKERYDNELSTDELRKILQEAKDYGISEFSVTGGEPLLRKDIFKIFEYAKELGFTTGLATNGFFVNIEISKKIANLFDSIQISLDGPEKVHNSIRRNDESFSRVLNAFKLLKLSNARQLTISSVITKLNFDTFDELSNIILDIKPFIWKIIFVMPIGNAAKDDLSLSEKEFKETLKGIKELRNNVRIEIGENCGYLGSFEEKVKNKPSFCPVGFLAMCLGANGKIRGCPEQPDDKYFLEGDSRTKSLKDIWEKGFEKYRKMHLTDNANCRKCKDLYSCFGGCWVMKTQNKNCTKEIYNLG